MTSIRYQTTLSLNEEDKKLEDSLLSRGISKISIYRAGIKALTEEQKEKE